jgi:hypothetical protein
MDFRWPRLDWTMFAFAAVAVYGAFLAAMFFAHFWLVDAHGHIVANDFIDVWTAGHMAWSGHAAQVYDWQAHRAAETAVAGQAFDGYFGWHYPPPFLFVAMALASVPYVVAFFAILIATLPLYLLVTDRIAQTKQAWLFALAFPATLMDLWVGQNGFLTAALIGGTLLLLEEQPLLSGICLGLLTYKPQFGILFPFVLLASGHWRTCLAAALTAGCMIGLSWLAFGSETWIAFFHSVPHTSEMILGSGRAGWNKLQTIYGFLRWAGASDGAAWSAQIATALLLLAGLIAMWRSRLPFALRAAALCVCTLLATPYAYIYDFPLLALAIAFLYRDRAFNRYETGIVGAACLLILAFPWTGAPLGLASSLLVASLVSRRARVLIPAREKTPSRFELDKLAVAGAGAVVFAYAAALAMMFVRHLWIVDAKGRPLVIDFVEVWVAGLSVLSGNPSAPYDWRLHHAAQVAVVGHPFAGFLGWHYPPLFLFVAAALAALPYVPAFIAWVCATAALYAFAIWKIAKRSEAALIALAMPAALGCAVVGQNGFFTAAIIGAALLALESRPWIAGLFLGLLTYKPQFGLLFPLVLLLDGNWRALASATIATAALLALSWLTFGEAPFEAFFSYLPVTANAILGHGTAGFEKLQSIYGLARWLGANGTTAWLAHGAATLAAAFGVIWLWKRDVPYALKAAALASATLIATPYLYMYDFPLLAVPFAFLFRARAFDRVEIGAIVAVNAVMLIFAWTAVPVGPLLALLPAALIARRLMPAPAGDIALQRA